MGVDTSGLDELDAAAKVIEAITDFIASLGLPRTLKEAGGDIAMAERMTEEAMGDGQMFGNPRQAEFEEILTLYEGLLA